MKIAYWGPYVGNIGTIKAQINSAAGFRKYGNHDVVLLKAHSEWSGYEQQIESYGLRVHDLGLGKLFPNLVSKGSFHNRVFMLVVALFGRPRLRRFLAIEQVDVLITSLIALPAIKAAKSLKNPPIIVASVQGYPKFLGLPDATHYPLWMKVEDTVRRRRWNRIYPTVDIVVSLTEDTRKKLVDQTDLRPERTIVVPNPIVDDLLFRMAESSIDTSQAKLDGRPLVLGVGRLTRQKGFDTLIRATAEVTKSQDVQLLILGDGEERPMLEALVDQLDLSAVVSMPGFVSNPYPYMKACDVFVLSSLWEDPGHAVIEAAALEKPIVTTNCKNGPPQLIEYGKGGELCEVGDHKGMADGILAILSVARYMKAKNAKEKSKMYTVEAHYRAIAGHIQKARSVKDAD